MTHITTWEQEGVFLQFSGTLTLEEIRQCNDELYSDPRFSNVKYQVCDYSDVEQINLTIKETKVLAAIDKGASVSITEMKVALITTDKQLMELGSQYIETSKKLNSTWEFCLCDSVEDARKWISS